MLCIFEYHRGADDIYLLEFSASLRLDCRVEHRRGNSLVFGKQVVRELVEVANASDFCGPGDHLVYVSISSATSFTSLASPCTNR